MPSMLVANAAPSWSGLGGSITGKIAVISNSEGTLQVFARGTDNALWTIAQISPDGPWGGWQNLGGVISSSPAVGMNGLGLLEVFALGSDGSLWKISQFTRDGPFTGWEGLGQTLTGEPAVTTDANGNLHAFAPGSDHALWTIAEASPGAYGGWVSLGGYILYSPAVITNTNGSVEVFATGSDNGVWHNWTVDSAFDWNGWASLGGSGFAAGSPAAVVKNTGTNAPPPWAPFGTALVVVTGTDSELYEAYHPVGQGWSFFLGLDGKLTSDPSPSNDVSGFIEVFARGADNALWFRPTPQVTFSPGWASPGGALANGPTAAQNRDGRVAVFVEGTDTTLWTIEQSSPGSWQ